MDATAIFRSLEALIDQEEDVVDGFALASIYVRALTSGQNPRDIAEAIWKALPETEAWPAMRDALLANLEEGGEGSGRTSPP